jgi:hypothetical protein
MSSIIESSLFVDRNRLFIRTLFGEGQGSSQSITHVTEIAWTDKYPDEAKAMTPPTKHSIGPIISEFEKTPKNNYKMTMTFNSRGTEFLTEHNLSPTGFNCTCDSDVNVWNVLLSPDGSVMGKSLVVGVIEV